MKPRIIFYISLIFIISGCGIFNPSLKYQPKISDEYYFPPISTEFKERQAECMRLENFPCDYAKPNDTLGNFVNEWYSTHLKSLKEPILYNQVDNGKMIVRFTHLGTWSQPYSFRIENSNGKITGTYNRTKGLGGYDAGRRIKHEEKELNISDWNLLINKIDKTFWEIQTHDPNMILDGEEWILEVLIDEKYHVVTRNSPDVYDGKNYAELCKEVMKIYRE
ncbi:hypothetical protein [Aquimarina intermedia]|uniref:Lipoprotein n=1 Tax=Aquimarina intermedia TaxID=350814 RepID=A0A5S5BSJ3_9FLAO|nr:hypothetical protein [Aquimarina intermedia]TYP69904.1 hypothetical protein BD809_1161 [Aquimarina intermedia]